MAVSDKPLWIATVAVAGTIGLGTAIVHQWIIPTITAGLQFEIQSLKAERDKQQKLSAEAVEEKKKLSDETVKIRKQNDERERQSSAQIDLLTNQLFAFKMASIFQVGSPYPIGLDFVKIGDPKSKIREAYPNVSITEKGRSTTIEPISEPFTKISYVHSESKPDSKETITSIRYSASNLPRIIKGSKERVDAAWVEANLNRTLGKSFVIGRDDDCLLWRLSDKELVYYLRGSDWYFISGYTTYPAGCSISDEQAKRIEVQLKSDDGSAKADMRFSDNSTKEADAGP